MPISFAHLLGILLFALALVTGWRFSRFLGNLATYLIGWFSCALTMAVGGLFMGLEPVRIPGIVMCAGALYIGMNFPDRRTASGYLMPYLLCFLLFGAGLLFAGITPIRVPGIALCAGAFFSVMNLPEDESPAVRAGSYLLCLAAFGMGATMALIVA